MNGGKVVRWIAERKGAGGIRKYYLRICAVGKVDALAEPNGSRADRGRFHTGLVRGL